MGGKERGRERARNVGPRTSTQFLAVWPRVDAKASSRRSTELSRAVEAVVNVRTPLASFSHLGLMKGEPKKQPTKFLLGLARSTLVSHHRTLRAADRCDRN